MDYTFKWEATLISTKKDSKAILNLKLYSNKESLSDAWNEFNMEALKCFPDYSIKQQLMFPIRRYR